MSELSVILSPWSWPWNLVFGLGIGLDTLSLWPCGICPWPWSWVPSPSLLPTNQTSILYSTGYWQSFRNAFIRNSKGR